MPFGEFNAWLYRGPNGASQAFADIELVVAMLDGALRRYVAEAAPSRVFVHAGAVAHGGRAIVIPGGSFAGKSTLVAALVRAGADYYSDEYAVDEEGLVRPYVYPLSIRLSDPLKRERQAPASLNGRVGREPVPVGMIVATTYRPEITFHAGAAHGRAGMLVLLANAPVMERPDRLAMLRQAASSAVVLEAIVAKPMQPPRRSIPGPRARTAAGPGRERAVSAAQPRGNGHTVAYEVPARATPKRARRDRPSASPTGCIVRSRAPTTPRSPMSGRPRVPAPASGHRCRSRRRRCQCRPPAHGQAGRGRARKPPTLIVLGFEIEHLR